MQEGLQTDFEDELKERKERIANIQKEYPNLGILKEGSKILITSQKGNLMWVHTEEKTITQKKQLQGYPNRFSYYLRIPTKVRKEGDIWCVNAGKEIRDKFVKIIPMPKNLDPELMEKLINQKPIFNPKPQLRGASLPKGS